MKQVLQNLRTGAIDVAEVPAPYAGPGELLIRTTHSLISAGTERMLVDFGRAGWLAKARQQPDKVRQVLDKARTDGFLATLGAVQSKLDRPMALGYSNVGVVVEVGPGVGGFAVGDRVVSNGKHAQYVSVPRNLCAHVPEAVADECAAFAVIASVGLQGIRLAGPTLGESVAVTGLGLIGLLTVQLLRAQGCRVLGIDHDPARLAIARQFGAATVDLSRGEDPLSAAASFSRGRGIDAVLIAAATTSNEPVSQAARMCRQRGRIVLVGVTGLELSRADFYEKELSFQVSCSYGPGRYDPSYEEGGRDYPIGFVRWTEQRNFEAVLDLMARGNFDVTPLITHRYSISDAAQAYALIAMREPAVGIVLQYPPGDDAGVRASERTLSLSSAHDAVPRRSGSAARIGVIGCGNHATHVLLPALQAAGGELVAVASRSGATAAHAARRFGAEMTTTDAAAVLERHDIDAIVVATRHDSHADYVRRALAAGKGVFVEKPLALRSGELDEVLAAYDRALAQDPTLAVMVGFNRRFSPHAVKARELLAGIAEPKCLVVTVNAGAVPANHWTQDPEVGGGRLVGEGCHFVDLMRFLVGAPITSYEVTSVGQPVNGTAGDNFTLTLSFQDGSMGTLHYFANGHRRFAKEQVQVFGANRVLEIDNFRTMRGFGWPRFGKMDLWRQDKGQRACVDAFVRCIRAGRASPVPFAESIEVSRVCIEAAQRLR
jgi:predicted dehydrogenase